MEGEVGGAISYFSTSLNKLFNNDPNKVTWDKERDTFVKRFTKLASNSKDKIINSELSFEELTDKMTEFIAKSEKYQDK